MHVKLVALHNNLYDAWRKVFAGISQVEVIQGSVFDHPADALVSPANSFGYMNGGIDFSISKQLGWHIEKDLQERIRRKYHGELLVGQAEILPTGSQLFPYLISAPTMRTPMTIHRTPNAYLAMRAILLCISKGKLDDGTAVSQAVRSVVIPGLGTGVGEMPPLVAARQMRLAWEDIMHENFASIKGWKEMGKNYAYFFTHDEKNIFYDIP